MLDELVRLGFGLGLTFLAQGGDYLSLEGRPIPVVVQGSGAQTVMFLGGMHGDEPQGQALVERLIQELPRHHDLLATRRIVSLPRVNPDGLLRQSRTNAAGVDINRNFPSRDWQLSEPDRYYSGPYAVSEPETRAVMTVAHQYQPVRIISIHAPLALINYDGPPVARRLAEHMSRSCGRPPRAEVGYPTPGSLGTYYGQDLRTPVITLETGPEPTSGLWRRYGKALLDAVAFSEAVES